MARADFTVGVICALSLELSAIRLQLDEEYADLEDEDCDACDDNSYVYGRSWKYNIVFATLPNGQYGTSNAAAVSKDVIRSFPLLRFMLMVGIGGESPLIEQDGDKVKLKRDIRLGDVVVSSSANAKGDIVQTDFGKALTDGLHGTDHPNQSPKVLLTAVAMSRSDQRSQRQSHKAEANARGFAGLVYIQCIPFRRTTVIGSSICLRKL